MPYPEGEDLRRQLETFRTNNLIPIVLLVMDEDPTGLSDQYLLGCFAVPRVGEVIQYGETAVRVVTVLHQFLAAPGPKLSGRVQKIFVYGREEPWAGKTTISPDLEE